MALSDKPLTECPSNLREAIDWILRVTGKDGVGGQDGTQALTEQVKKLLEGASREINSLSDSDRKNAGELKKLKEGLDKAKDWVGENLDDPMFQYSGTPGPIGNLSKALASFIGYTPFLLDYTIGKRITGDGIALKSYASSYPSAAKWESVNSQDDKEKLCAKIFLGCIPLCYYALTYLYWRCSLDYLNGGWKTLQLTFKGVGDPALKNYMVGMGYKASELNGAIGQHVQELMNKKFTDFKEGITKAASTATERAKKENEVKKKIYPGTSSPSSPPAEPTYPEFLNKLCDDASSKINTQITNSAQGHALSALYCVSYLYFKGKQSALSNAPELKPRPPSTIREMLYFLAALPFSHSYDEFDKYITQLFTKLVNNDSVSTDAELMIPVADSSSPNTNNTLSAADLKDYLTTTCLHCPTILGRFQGNSADSGDEPWLHSLFSNKQFSLAYPAGAPLFNVIANYAYALQFQLSFLYQQCSLGSTQGCCWRQCKYGQNIMPNLKSKNFPVPSHICSTPCQDTNKSECQHNSKTCKHGDQCGNNTNNSPLQGFLTDNLSGFSLSKVPDTGSLNHLENHPPGSMCHIPMGFQSTDLRSSGSGHYIYYTLDHFCGYAYGPLPQLSEKLGCLTKRTPRTLGDVFGFLWHLNGQLFNKPQLVGKLRDALISHPNSVDDFIEALKSSLKQISPQSSPEGSGLVKSLQTMGSAIPFLYQLFTVNSDEFLPVSLFNLAQHCHKVEKIDRSFKIVHKSPSGSSVTPGHDCPSSPNDLWSIYQPVRPTLGGAEDTQEACRDTNCGGYLYPLTHSDSATYVPSHASAYLSWLAYLTDDFHEWFQNLLNGFKNIDCKTSGCKPKSSGTCSCTKGQHGSVPPQCSCQSVVQCGGVLPLLYRHGFQFTDAYSLNGGKEGKDKSRRSCDKFHSQLSNVLSPDAPLAKLLETIDSFLYLFRFYFFYNLSTFWLCSLAILLYFLIYGIDVLHFKSHVRFPSSHELPPIGLLTTGKAPALTKLTYYMP
ncbi:variant erythrocyte surface antigen-1 family protein [Babesia caballi]|uniref:Variant erythrocyte surface antigen-1 family protein n=1 Tax=Babesia caballi TaxID=5871 RepID=A0AAV4LS82_BABCB|nr:variant erythrocyte surface antigen-1 family protein [Babesia caballi]